MINYDGIPQLSFQESEWERDLFRSFEDRLIAEGFRYLSVPSSITWEMLRAQGFGYETLAVDDTHVLTGSAEQGLLAHYAGLEVEPHRVYALNQCWRLESEFEGFKRCKEFKKLEQFSWCSPDTWQDEFYLLLSTVTDFYESHGLSWRIVDCTSDAGSHEVKKDIEVLTEQYGWLEMNSCSHFGFLHRDLLGIQGEVHSISNTGLASPRILIPFRERGYL